MKFIKKSKSNLEKIERLTGLKPKELDILIEKVDVLWEEAEKKRLSMREDRKRRIGGGRKYKLGDIRTKALVALIYYRLYLTQDVLSLMFDINQSAVSRLLKKMLPLIEQAADPTMKTFSDIKKQEGKRRELGELIEKYPEIKEVCTDATEQCYRSKRLQNTRTILFWEKQNNTQ